MAEENKKSNLVYHIWDADNKEYEVPDSDMQDLGYDNIAKTFEGGYITMFDDKKQKVDVPIEDARDYRNKGYMWYDASGSATPINEIGKKPSVPQQEENTPEIAGNSNSQEKQPGLISQALGMIPEVLKPTELSEKQQQRARELPFAKLQESLANKQMDEALASPNAPVETISGAMGVAGQQVADPINQWSAAYENYYGKEGVDPFQSVVQDIMATGAGDEDPNVPVQMAHQALERFADRTAKAHTQALVANLPEGVSIDEGIENQWYSHDVQDKLQAEAKKMGISYDDYVAHFLKPSLVQSLKQKIPSMKDSDAQEIALRLFSHEDDMENRLLDKDIADMLGKYMDEPIDNAITKAGNEAKASLGDAITRAKENTGPLQQYELLKGILASNKLKDPERVKENLQGQIEDILTNTDITLDLVKLMDKKGLSYDKLDEVMQKRVYPAVMNVLESKLSDKYIQKYMPKGSLEYIVKSAINNTIAGKVYRKMTQSDYQNWLEDMAYQQYQPGFWERVGSGALTFAGDAWSYWVPGLAGGKLTKSIISRAEASLTRDLVSRGVAGQTAARLARIIVNRSKARMIGTGAVNGAVTFGGQQVISTPVDEGYRSGQFDENGNVYHTNIGKAVRTTAKNATRESLMGAVLQGGTVANMIGKGRGLAANILADVGGKAFDSALMTGSSILEQKMADPSYQITGKGVAENFLESMANLTAISFPHIVKKYVNFKDAQAFNKAAGFSKDDIATMKKAGYGDLHTALEKLATVKPEYRTEGWMERELANAYADPSIKFGAGDTAEDKTAYLTDEYKNFLSDKDVPQTLKIKLQSVIEGKVPNRLPAIIDSRIVPTDDGKVNLETYDMDGKVVTRQVFDSKEKADEANHQITLQKDLNAISLSENLYEANVIRDKIQQLYNDAQEKYAMGQPLSDEEKSAVYLYQQANRVTGLRSKLADVQSLTPEEQRASLSDNDRRFIETYEKMLGEFKGSQDSELSDYIHNFESSLGFKRGSTHRALEGHTKEEADRIAALNKSNARNSEFKNGVTYHSLYEPDGKDGETTFIPIGNGRYRTVMEQRIVDAYRNQLLNDVGIRTEMRETEKEISNPNEEVENIPEQVSPVNSAPVAENGREQENSEHSAVEAEMPSTTDTAAPEPPVSDGPAPYQDRTNSVPSPSDSEFAANPANETKNENKVSDAYVIGQNTYKNGDSEALQAINHNDDMAMARLVRAFADSEKMPDIVANSYNEGKDMELFVAQRSGSLTPAQKEAISKYVEAMDAKKGVSDAYLQEDAGYQENLVEQMKPYATEDGNIQMVELDSGKQVYLKKNGESDMVFIVAPDDQGNPVVKTISKSKIVDMGKPIPFDTFINQEVQRHEQQRNSDFLSQFGKDKLTVGEKVDLAINLNDTPVKAEIVSINNDGTVSFVLGNSSRVQQVPREEFRKMRNFANTIGINAELDAEDAQRAEKEAIQAEAEKKQRFANGIVGLSEQKPDYTSKETDTKVAAEYLQEQYADNHDQLIKLVNGSRSDIKEQIDNIRKRIVEAEDWLDTNADLEPEQAQSREDKLKLAKEQLEDLTTRYDNWNKIRSLIMTEEEKRELKDERTANIKKIGIDKEALTVTDEREVPVLTDEELKKQYPAMDEASDYILSQRKEISKTQEGLHRQLEDIDARLNQYLRGEADLADEEIRDFNTTKADLEARQANLTESAKELKAQADKLKKLYMQENKKERAAILTEMTPAEQRRVKAEQYLKDGNISGLMKLYGDTSVDFTDNHPNTVDEYVATSIGRYTLNYEGREVDGTFLNGLQQELGVARKDFEKKQILAAEGKGLTFDKYVNDLYDNLPDNLRNQGVNTQEIRNSLLALLRGAEKYSDLKNYILKDKIAKAEEEMRPMDLAEEEQRAAYEAEKGQQMQEQVGDVSAKYSLSSETAGNGEQFYQDAEGNIDLANVPQEVFEQIGYTAAPFRLTPKMIKHMMDRHNTELKFSSPDEAIDFVRDVMNNFDHVRLGYDGALVFSIEDGRKRTGKRAVTILINNDNGKFYGLKTSGYESVKGLEKRPLLWERGANEKTSSTDAATASVTTSKSSLSSEQSGSASHQGNDLLSDGKDTNNSGNLQENSENFSERLQNAVAETETEPTEAQKKAGNYKKGHLTFGGYNFTVETPKGATRSGKDEQGKPWSVTMHDTYGYILGKIGVDGDHIDMFINDAADLDSFDGNVYVVDQVNPETGEFDEHKVMYGFPDETAATKAYLSNYSKGWKGLGKVTSVPKATFDKWLESSDRKTKPFAEYAMIQQEEAKKAKEDKESLPFDAPMNMDDLPFHRDVKEVKPSEMTEAQKVAYDAVSTMLKKAGIPVKVVSNEDMEKVAEAQDNLNLAMLLNHPEMRFKIKTPEEKQAAENAYNFAKELRPNKWAQYAVVDMSNPNKMPEYYPKQELARKERTYLNRLMWGNYKVFNLDKSFEDNVAGLTGSFPSEFDPYKIDEQTSKKNELKKQIKETEEAYKLTGQERKEYQNQLMKEYMDEHGLASENDIPDDVWREFDYKAIEKYQDKLDSLFAKYKDLDRQLKAIVQPGVRFLRIYHGSGANFSEFDFDHMGEGAGSQVFGWGGYVTSSKKIGKSYAEVGQQSVQSRRSYSEDTPIEAAVGAILGQEMYNSMQAKTFEQKKAQAIKNAENSIASYSDMLKNSNDLDEKSKKFLEKSIEKDKKELEVLRTLTEEQYKEEYIKQGRAKNLYEVDIPEDNGSNYLDWEKKPSDEVATKIIEGLYGLDAKTLDDMASKDIVFRTLLYDYIKNADKEQMIPLLVKTHALTRGTTYDNGNVEDDIRFVYTRLSNWMGSPKAASKFLSSLGYTGIKYPAGTIMGGADKGDTNYVIFNPKDMKIVDHTKFAQGKGVVYGYTDGKEIVLNQEHLNPNTPIHEYQHLWRTAAKKMNPELIAHGDELIKQTQLFADLKEDPNYKHLSDDEICDEAFARLTGEDGAAILEQMAKDAIKENPLDTAKELTIINRLKNWLKKFWYWTLDTFTKWKPEDIKRMTLEDIRNLVLRDLANGVDPRNVKSRMTKEEAVSLRKQMADNAEQERILEHTEENWLKEFGKDSRVTTPIGSIKLGENQYKKAGRNDRIKRFGLLKPTLERPDVILEKSAPKEGAERQTKYLFIKSFKKADGNKILNYESITVKQGEEEVAISAHQIDPSKVVKELTESKVLWNRFRGDSNSLGENQGSALTPSANNPSGKDSVLNPHSDAKIRNNIETAKGNDGNLSVEDKIKAVSQQFGVDEADVAMYANAIKKGSTAEAARARANIKRHLLQANEDKISSLKELLKYTKPVNEALKENFGDVDAMIEERVKQVEAQRNAMEAARKRAEEEEAKRQKHLEELSVIPDDQLDKQYIDALAKGDDATAREMLDEAARRKGYDDTESAYQGVGAWAAPGNPGYESDKARRDDWESSGSDVNLEDMALGYTPQPDDYFSHPERYSQNTPHGLESVKAINTAIDAIKNGEKDVKVKVYRAVPTSVKEGKLRNGDWVTPSKKYAEMHGANRLEGKYRIIEDEVPASQLWWDGNDANEFGFDDGKEYKYKNAKNNRKLNDLVTYDDEGDVIPPSKRFNSRKSDIRFMFAGEKGASEADKAEEKTYRMDNLKVAEKMERGKKDAKAIKLATGWERGADGKWRYEMPDAKIKDMKDIGGGHIVKRFDDDMLWNGGKLADVIDAPGLFEAYPQLKDVRIDTDAIMNDMPSNGVYNAKTNTITIHADELKYMNSILNHEIQHAIQYIEGFAKGGSPGQMEKDFKEAQDEWKARAYAHELEEKAKEMGGEYNQSEVEKALVEEYKDLDMSDELPDKETRIKGFNYFARGYADRSMDDAIKRFRLNESTRSDFDSYKEYLKLAGEVESRNVEKRLGMTDEERRNSLAEETEDVNRDEQIVMNGNDASYSIVKDPETIKKLDKEDTVKVYRAMQIGEDGKLYPPMAAKVKGKFVEPIELGKWEQADERPELADDKGMFTLNKGNGKSLKAAYNPYLHTSRTPLNDQFSEAQNRPNIVTVEVEVPKSELTSGYKADKAKDAVGEVEWKAGIIQGQLTGKRKVVLSRWDKPVRIVPDSEVADVIVNDMFKGKNITMPSNVVTPSLRKELEKRGVPFVETDNRGRIVGGENDGVHYSKVYGKNHRGKGYRSILKFSLGDNGTDVADGNGDSINKNPNKNVITRRIGSREQAQRRVNETLGAAASDLQRSLGATAKEQRPTWNRRSALGYVRRRAEELSSLLTEKDLKEIQGGYIGHGQENYVYQAKYDDKKVIKFNDFSLTDSLFRINEFIDRVNAHNQFQPKDKYTPIGFAYDEKGDFCIVMEQPYLKGTQPTREEITQYLTDHGFKLDMIQISADEVDLGWTNGEFDLWDAEPRNVIKDENGDLHFFDTMIQHTYIPNHKNPLRLSMPSIRTFESQEMKNSADKVKNVANILGGAEAVTYTSSADVPEEYRVAIELGAKGWYDPTTHTVHVYLPNCADANEAQRTVFHEKIGHEGMEVLLGGEDEVRKFANFVYNSVAASTRGKILEIANEYDPDWKKHDRMNVGTQEYIARLAEEGPKTAEDFTLWTKIKHYLIKVLKKLGIRVPGLLNDKDLRYYLMKAGKALHVWDNMPKEKQEAMMKQASNAEIKDSLGEETDLSSEEDDKPKKKTERGRIDEATGAFKLAPNGEQSNLSKKQYIEARTKNFKVWFGGDWEKKPKDFKNKLDANGEPLEKYVEGYLNRPKKPTMPKKRKGEDEATFFERKMLYSQALEDWPKTEADWKKRIDEFDENTLAALTPPDEEAIREKYQKQYENDMGSWRKDHHIEEGEERTLKYPDMRDYQSIQDYGEALRKHEIWKTAPIKDEYERMAEDEIVSKVALMDAVQHPFSEYARLKAMKAEFQHMRHVMKNQKVYDQNTTDAVVQFAKRFMSLGYGDDLGRGSINTLLTIVKNSTGRKSHEIPQQLYQVMDVLMNNQLRNFDRAVMKTMSIKELKENAKGVQVQGKLELRGQTTIKAFRDAVSSRISSDKLDEKISNLIDKMTDDRKNASSYQDELLGLNLAKQYVDYIDSSRNDAIEIEDLKKKEIEDYKNRKGIYKGELTEALLQEHVERLNQYDEALFNNKVERMDRYSQLLANLGGMIDESVKGAREFQERDSRRAINVKMMASADLADKSMNQHHKENWKTRLSNSDVTRLFCSPLGSFDALMREFGSKQINGEGQLWNHFVRGAMKASNDEFKSVREANNEIDLKVSELFGKVTEDKNGNKKGNMILNDLYALERSNKVKSLDVTIRDIEGEQTYKLQQGNLMYIYMVNKMPDGAMKLREMGILDADVERIKENIDPRFLKLADWIQGEFLPKMRTKYNKRHEELFGAPMPMVENYFPLRVLKNARYMEEDVNNTSDGSNALPSTATGAIIKRKTNKLPLDILNADALSVTIDNIKEMENWYNYAPIRKDANTLLSDTTFRNRVQNMTTIYGSGERLWNNLKDATAVAMGTYRPKGGTDLAVSLKNIGKGITGAKISFRLYTAFKQILSAPLFLADADLGRFAWYSANPYGSFKWAIENMPNFDKRWSGRKLGDTVLMDDPTDWKLWHTNLMEKAAYYGMTPNALVDAVTCAVGARAVYDTKYKQYIKAGLTEERAKEKALSDAEINFNTSQQSSEGAFVSPMQLDRTLESAIFTPFRNSSMLYERKGINALRNLKHRFEKGHKEASVKFMAGQLMDEGVGYEQATKAAEKMYQKGLMHNIADAIVALWLGPIIWNLGGSLGYLIPYLGDDENKKKKMVLDAVILGLLEGPVDGLAGGQFINTAIANTITSDGISLKGLKNVDFSGMPMLSDLNSMIEKFGYDKVAGAQDLMFMVMQSSTGFNPKTLTDAINACIDYGNGDMTNAKEIALFVFRLMNGPTATVDNLYIDELGMKGKDAKKLSYEELAKRYAEYKFGKNTFGLGKLYSDEEKQKKLKAIEKSFDKKVSERLAGMDREDLKNEFSESRSQKEKKLIGKIIADELETKDSEAVKKAKADASYLRQRNFSDLMDDLFLQQEWESTKTAQDGLEELKGNGATEDEIESYKLHHKPEFDKRKAIEAARKAMGKEKKNLSSDNDAQVMAKIRAERDKVIIPLRKQKSKK